MVESCSAVNCCNRRRKDVKMKFHRIPTDPNMRKLWLIAIRRVNFTPSTSTVICEKHFTPDDYEVNVHGNRVLKKSAVPSVFDFPAHLKKKPTAQRRVLKRKREESTSKETDQTLDICEAVEEPENDPISVDGNLLVAGPSSNSALNPEHLESSEPSNICNLQAGPSSNSAQNPEHLESSELSNMCNLRREPVFFGDFKFSDLSNLQRRKRFWKITHETVYKYRKMIKYNKCTIRRQKDKINSLNSLVDQLCEEKKISAAQSLVLKVDI
ncbi:unnamed protein product [Acanthoscelides obtectus]|uniref:THAP-type domain-containing protein n=2 Tax=Acanthoscelides obtectus TaxID=200917 RepID=A0A9P0LC67_ACAOB|nr:unnamed protein product [Acanthoscelides obtectus]CAH2004512.1 unnamed protein product [Acanthoscelides obtectus]CAK1620013.1 THAP domain-containing protein 2 [Acanthoscelides obtectus]CAK1669078.1 THAP domain-containing protein 2 [Acanthoscelides obtectus]